MSDDWIRSRLRTAAQAPVTPLEPETVASLAKGVRRRRIGASAAVAVVAVGALAYTLAGTSPRHDVVLAPDAGTSPTPTTSPDVSPTLTPSTAPTPPAPDRTERPVCDAERQPPETATTTTTHVDLDGDGRPDTLLLDLPPDEGLPVTLYALLEDGGTASLVLDDTVATAALVDVATALDLDGDGNEEALVFLGGNTALLYGVVTLRGCELVRVGDEDGDAVTLYSGSSLLDRAGVRCEGGHVVQQHFEHEEGATSGLLTERRYVLDGTVLRFVDERQERLDEPPPGIATVCGT